jgi:hypothetical protein
MGSQKWDEMVQWPKYKGLILEEAERRGLIWLLKLFGNPYPSGKYPLKA